MKSKSTSLKLISVSTQNAARGASDKIKHIISMAARSANTGLENAKGKVVNIADYASMKVAQFEAALHDPQMEVILDDFIMNHSNIKKIIVDRLNRGDQKTRINAKIVFVLTHTGKKGRELALAIAKAAGKKDPRSIIDAVRSGAVFASTILRLLESRKKHSA